MSWEHEYDTMLWMGGRTQDDANHTEYEPQNIKDFIFQYITENDEKPTTQTVLDDLNLLDEMYDDVRLELMIYNHEEEVEFRTEEVTNEQFTSPI